MSTSLYPFSLQPALCLLGWKEDLGTLRQHVGIVSEEAEASPTQQVCSDFLLYNEMLDYLSGFCSSFQWQPLIDTAMFRAVLFTKVRSWKQALDE